MLQVRFWIRWRRLNLLELHPTVEKKRAQTQNTLYLPKETSTKMKLWRLAAVRLRVYIPPFSHSFLSFFPFSFALGSCWMEGQAIFAAFKKVFKNERVLGSFQHRPAFVFKRCLYQCRLRNFLTSAQPAGLKGCPGNVNISSKKRFKRTIHRIQESSTQPKTFLAVLSLRFAGQAVFFFFFFFLPRG